MLFLTGLDDYAESAPLGGARGGRSVPTIATACGFAVRDYLPDPMDAPLGRLRFLLPDATEDRPPGTPADWRLDWPPAWAGVQGAVALAVVFVCDLLAPCDRLPGPTAADTASKPCAPLPRAHVTSRLGNLRDGRPRLDVLYGGACLQGTFAQARRKALFDGCGPQHLHPGALADGRLASHPLTLQAQAALATLHNALADDPAVADPRAATTALWLQLIRDDVLPRLCGIRPDAAPPAPAALPLEAALGPFSTLVAMLTVRDRPHLALAALGRQTRRAQRLSLPGPAALCAHLGLDPPETDLALPLHLLDEAHRTGRPFGPLGAALVLGTVGPLITAEARSQDLPGDGPYLPALEALRRLAATPARPER